MVGRWRQCCWYTSLFESCTGTAQWTCKHLWIQPNELLTNCKTQSKSVEKTKKRLCGQDVDLIECHLLTWEIVIYPSTHPFWKKMGNSQLYQGQRNSINWAVHALRRGFFDKITEARASRMKLEILSLPRTHSTVSTEALPSKQRKHLPIDLCSS